MTRVPLLLATLLLALPACAPARHLEGAFPSDDPLVRAVLDGFRQRHAAALQQLAVTREEYEDIVWPTLPVSRPEVGMPLEYVWNDTSRKSRAYLAESLARYGGRRFELVRIEFGAPTADRGSYTISPKTELVVRDEQGREGRIRLFGSIIRQGGRSKVFSYIVDD